MCQRPHGLTWTQPRPHSRQSLLKGQGSSSAAEPAQGALPKQKRGVFMQADLFCHLNIPLKAKHSKLPPALQRSYKLTELPQGQTHASLKSVCSTLSHDVAILPLGVYSKETESRDERFIQQRSQQHDSQEPKAETTHVVGWMDKQKVVPPHNGLFSLLKKILCFYWFCLFWGGGN